ncbi:hypothetical protein [Roseiconus lacunae]|uniref:hypothetical protein n=1 Tax=Roseiconus lacunae TaxID=2605694 RepID=UPI0011F2E698|nr:hypothetical protein [Roseiconus lacunae]
MSISIGAIPRLFLCLFIVGAWSTFRLSAQSPDARTSRHSEWKPLLVEFCRLVGEDAVSELEEAVSAANDRLKNHVIKVMRYRLQQSSGIDALRQRLSEVGWEFNGLELYVTAENRESVDDNDLQVLNMLPFVPRLDLSGIKVTDRGLERLAETPIRELVLTGTNISDEGIKRFVEKVRNQKANVSKRELEAAGLGIFGRHGFYGGTGLESVELGETKIGDQSVVYLSELNDLRAVILSGTNITDACFRSLAKVADLEILDVSRTSIGDEGVIQLSKLKRLRSLQLSDTNVTDESLPFLGKMVHLETLHLSGTATTERGLHHLAKLPNLDRLTLPELPPGENADDLRAKHLPRFFPWRASRNKSLYLGWDHWRALPKVEARERIRDLQRVAISMKERMMVVAFTPSYFEDRLKVLAIDFQTGNSKELTFGQGKELAYSCPIALSRDAELLATGAKRSTARKMVDEGGYEIQRVLRTVPIEQSKPEQVTIWRIPKVESEQVAPVHTIVAPWPVAKLAFSPNGAHLLVVSRMEAEPTDVLFAVVDVVTGELKPRKIATGELEPINQLLSMDSMALSPNGRTVAFSNRHGVGVVDTKRGEVDYLFHEAKAFYSGGPQYSSRGPHRHEFSLDGRWLLSTVNVLNVPDWEINRVLIYDRQSRRLTAQIIGRLEAVSDDGATIVTSEVNTISLWHLSDGVPVQFGFTQRVGNPVLSHDGRSLFSHTGPGGKARLGVWDLRNPK